MNKLLFIAVSLLFCISVKGKTVEDSPNCNLKLMFKSANSTYIIKYEHFFTDTLLIPCHSNIVFEGGCLSGPIIFKKTLLSGNVNIKGSSISGTLRNSLFDASWLCFIDGKTDDARNINEMLSVCNHIFFPRGTYLLESFYEASGPDDALYKNYITHIGINKSNVSLIGESGAEFVTSARASVMYIYTKPNMINKSIHDINIENIIITVNNDGKEFHQWKHAINLMGVNKLQIKDCTINDFYGDAICLNHYGDNPETGERSRNQNIIILDNTITGGPTHNNRNGISVINGKNVLIKGNIIKNTSRDDMPGGIDVEPNNSAYTIDNITIEDNLLENIGGSCGAISLISVHEGPLHRISIINNKILNSNNGLLVCIGTDNTTDNITIKGNYIDDKTNPYRFWGKGHSCVWTIEDNVFEQACYQSIPGEITVKKIVQRNNKKKEH